MSKAGSIKREPGAVTLASAVLPLIQRDIVTGYLRPGEKIHIGQLCERHGTGLAPVREALNRLATEGLVRQEDRLGFRVTPLRREDLLDILRSRCFVDGEALRQSIAHADPPWEERLVLAHHKMSRITRGTASEAEVRRGSEWGTAHREFHEALLAACPSAWLLTFSRQLFIAAERFRYIASGAAGERAAAIDREHREIMEAAVEGRSEEAVALLTAHYRRTADLALAPLDA